MISRGIRYLKNVIPVLSHFFEVIACLKWGVDSYTTYYARVDDPLNPGQYCADWDDRRCVWVIIFSNYQIAFKNTTLIINKNNFSENVYIFGIWIDWECKE